MLHRTSSPNVISSIESVGGTEAEIATSSYRNSDIIV